MPKDPIIPSVEAIEDLQRCVTYWGERCERAEAALRQIADHPDSSYEAAFIAREQLRKR